MKKTRENLLEKLLQQKRHPIRPKLVSALLSICLLLASLPAELYGFQVQAEGQEYKILSFSELPEEVRSQNVEPGTPLEELNLPKTLEAVCVPLQYEEPELAENQGQTLSDTKWKHGEGGDNLPPVTEKNQEKGKEISPSDAEPEPEGDLEPPASDTEGDLEEQPQPGETPQEQTETDSAAEETVVIEHITWSSVFAYDNEKEGTYVFVPVLPKGYVLGEGVSLPEIQVLVEYREDSGEAGKGQTAGGKKDKKKAEEESDRTYGGIEREMTTTDSDSEVIRVDTVWDTPKTLFGGELVIEEGVILTLNTVLTIDGEVTVRGGGIIKIKGVRSGINVMESGALTIQGMTLHGNKDILAYRALIRVMGGKLIVERSRIQDYKSRTWYETVSKEEEEGGAIYFAGGATVNLKTCIIEGCTTGRGGAVHGKEGTLTMEEGCVIRNCIAVAGGALYFDKNVSADLRDSRLEECYANDPRYSGGSGGAVWMDQSTISIKACTIENSKKIDGYNPGAAIRCSTRSTLTMDGSTIKNFSGGRASGGAIEAGASTINIKGSKIEECSAFQGGAISTRMASFVNIKDSKIGDCSADRSGGAVWCDGGGELTMEGCVIQNCSAGTTGGAVNSESAYVEGAVSLKDCKIENCSADKGGGIYTSKDHITVYDGVKFCEYKSDSGKDCVYFENSDTVQPCIKIGANLSYPASVYLAAREKYVIAEGIDGYGLTIEDLKKLLVVDVNGGQWYKKLDEEQNQIYLTANDPGYSFRVFYYDVDGKVTDNTEYNPGESVTIKSVEGLPAPIPNQDRFLGWSKKPGAAQVDYTEGESVEITEDIHLYPVYEKRKFSADFYSGGPDSSAPVHEEREAGEDEDEITINAPALKAFEGWTPKGWGEDPEEYGSGNIIQKGGACTLTEDTKNYYGVYQKEVTLSYDSADQEIHISVPEVKEFCYANVHDAITYQKAKITLAEGPEVFGYTFQGWSEQADGGGTLQKAGTEISIQEDTELYAVYREKDKRTFTANFYSGSPVFMEPKAVTVYEPAQEGKVMAPSLKDFSEWKPLGWSRSNKEYETSVGIGEECTLTEDVTEFCGIYEKDITLTYKGNGGKPELEAETNQSYANVHKEDLDDGGVSYKIPEFTITGEMQREKYILTGWSRDQDSIEAEYKVGSKQEFDKDTILYAVWKEIPPGEAEWKMEYYCQNLKGDGYDKIEADTETFTGKIGTEAEIREKTYQGFSVNSSHPEGKRKGVIAEDGSLVLKLYYDRNIYKVDFDLNEGDGIAPSPQTVRYGDKAKEPETPKRTGYRFKGWYKDKKGTEGSQWNFSRLVEENTKTLHNTLYAVWEKITPGPDPDQPDPGNPDNPDPDHPDNPGPNPDQPGTDPDNPDPDHPDNPGPNPDQPGTDPDNPDPDNPDNPGPNPDQPGTDSDNPGQETPAEASYQTEHYCQNLTGDEYTRVDADTEILTGEIGAEAEARGKAYPGFTLNLSHPLGKTSGTIEKDGSLVLKLYYDRNIYEVDFNLNGGRGTQPKTQKIRYGGRLEQVSEPTRTGYHFKGWQIGEEPDGDVWDFDSPVEYNTGTLHTTLYAKWADELAPILGEAAFTEGSRNFLDWLLQKESMVITVPVTEEGSGLAKAEYLLLAEDGSEKEGEARLDEARSISPVAAAYGSGATVLRRVQAEAEQGKYKARIAIEEEFKGKVYLTCTDHAGNRSARKILTAKGGGVIVEENAPEIYFSDTEESAGGKPLKVKVKVVDDMEGHVSGGISGIRYQVDGGKKKSLPDEDFTQEFVAEYEFALKLQGEGAHTLRVEAEDHGGNKSAAEVTLRIQEKKDEPVQTPVPKEPGTPLDSGKPGKSGTPLGAEPKTGEGSQVKVFATLAMIAGFGYLLLYFEGENGITEQEKEEIIYRVVAWAKKGKSLRRLVGLAVIFLFLMYYHSIGKSVDVEWKEMYVKGN